MAREMAPSRRLSPSVIESASSTRGRLGSDQFELNAIELASNATGPLKEQALHQEREDRTGRKTSCAEGSTVISISLARGWDSCFRGQS